MPPMHRRWVTLEAVEAHDQRQTRFVHGGSSTTYRSLRKKLWLRMGEMLQTGGESWVEVGLKLVKVGESW